MFLRKCLVVSLSLLLAPVIGFTAEQSGSGNADDPVAAIVNNRTIHLSQLRPRVEQALSKYRKHGASNVSDETRKQILKQELDRQIAFELLAQAGERITTTHLTDTHTAEAETGIEPDGEEEADNSYEEPDGRTAYVERYLAQQGIQQLRVPEAELRKYYQENLASFIEPESVQARHILIPLPPQASPKEVEQAKQAAERIHDQARSGRDFAELARQYSACATAQLGGELGLIGRGYMPHEFDQVAFALQQGELGPPVRTRHGFHIIKINKKNKQRTQEFTEVKGAIETLLLKQLRTKKIEEWAAELARQAQISVQLK